MGRSGGKSQLAPPLGTVGSKEQDTEVAPASGGWSTCRLVPPSSGLGSLRGRMWQPGELHPVALLRAGPAWAGAGEEGEGCQPLDFLPRLTVQLGQVRTVIVASRPLPRDLPDGVPHGSHC